MPSEAPCEAVFHRGGVVELTRAAHEVVTLSEGEKLRLLGRAYVTIREGWRVLVESVRRGRSAESVDLIPVHLYNGEMKAILLKAAKAIREINAAIAAKGGIEPPAALATKDR